MIQELNHVSVGVEDLEKSVKFYTEIMGMEIDYRAYHEGDKISKVVGVDNAVLDICVVKKGPCCIELIEYKNKAMRYREHKRQNEPGLIHISFFVTDVDEEYDKIQSLGYESFSPPMVTRENGPKICYFKGPDNVIIELYEKR
ncbi:MAG: VOC family protein [Spirochaetota bacterium]|nr:MAG: VOC family protein [Spirochaetota bacterium]